MSAYIVDRNHIVYLVTAGMKLRQYNLHWRHNNKSHCLTGSDITAAARIANILWLENINSIFARYPSCKDDPSGMPGPTKENYIVSEKELPARILTIDAVQLLKSCDCYEYQACEHDGWEKSEAKAFIDALRSAYIHKLPGYSDAEWGAPRSMKTH